jgi:hypothetical protein
MTVTPRLERMVKFFADVRAWQAARREQRLREMADFLATFEATHRRVWRSRVDFNVFDLLKVATDEVCHSGVLAWLLDAESGHGQGVLFMQTFAELLQLDLPPQAFARYQVRTELARAESIIDVTVFQRGAFLIYLENKILAAEGLKQLEREFRDMRRLGAALRVPQDRQFAIFLTPDGRPPISGSATRWRTVSYPEIAGAFQALLSGINSTRVKIMLNDWIRTVSTFGGTDELAV